MNKKIFAALTFPILYSLFFIPSVNAAALLLSTKSEGVAIGDQVEVEARIDSEEAGFNAAQATIQFSNDILEVVSLDQSKSVFNFWLEDPSFSNDSGKISFIGGSTSGFAGKSLQVLKIVFKVKGAGAANLVFTDGAVTASDGSGTNILSAMQGLKISSVSKQQVVEISKPVQIVRKAAAAEELPKKPAIEVSLYPDPAKWHNLSSPFFVNWKLPPDVTDVYAALNRQPDFSSTQSEGLFESKRFSPLEDGIWYLHARFKNNIGWGPSNHHRLAVDTAPPVAFTLSVDEGLSTDNPKPTIRYQSADALSGLESYEIRIDDLDPIKTLEEFYTLPLQPPGKHFIRVKAVDKAGNSAESGLELETLPIASPKIISVSKDVFVGEGGLEVIGTALPDISVLLSLKHRSGRVVFSTAVNSDSRGNWETKLDQPLKRGKHFVQATTQDKRGALSLPVQSTAIKVRERPLLNIFGIEITQAWFFIGLIVILSGGFWGGWFSYRLWRAQVDRKIIVAQRDVISAFEMVKKDIDGMLAKYADKQVTPAELSDIEFTLKKVKEGLKKMQKYIVENIEEISE